MVTVSYLPNVGGVEQHTYEVSRRLAAQGDEVTVITTDLKVTRPETERVEGVTVVRVPAWPRSPALRFSVHLVPMIVRGKWDIVHCQGYHPVVPVVSMLTALSAQFPYLLSFHSSGHGDQHDTTFQRIKWALLRPLMARAKSLVCVSQYEADRFMQILRLPAARFEVIPNGAELPDAAPKLPHRDQLILSVGRLERYKGHHRVVAAMPELLRHVPNARLRIVGSGPFEPELRRQIESLGLEDRVEIAAVETGNRKGMAELLASAAVVTLLSEYESQCVAIAEAVLARRPVVVASTSALNEFVQRGHARGVPLDSTPVEVAQALMHQIIDPLIPAPDAVGTWDDCASALSSLYRRIIHSRKRA